MTSRQLFKYSQGEWAGAVNNHFMASPIYIFSLAIKAFQYIISKKYRVTGRWRYNHTIRVVDGYVIEMLAAGRVTTRLDEWVMKHKRTVVFFRPLIPFLLRIAKPYDFFGIPQVSLHHVRQGLKIGNSWNGVSGVPKSWEGEFCSEELGLALGRENAHHLLPCQIFELEELQEEETVETGYRENIS